MSEPMTDESLRARVKEHKKLSKEGVVISDALVRAAQQWRNEPMCVSSTFIDTASQLGFLAGREIRTRDGGWIQIRPSRKFLGRGWDIQIGPGEDGGAPRVIEGVDGDTALKCVREVMVERPVLVEVLIERVGKLRCPACASDGMTLGSAALDQDFVPCAECSGVIEILRRLAEVDQMRLPGATGERE